MDIRKNIKNVMNKEIPNENIKIRVACVDDKVIWASDEAIAGLYTIDKKTFEVKNILNSFQVFKHGRFELVSIIKWEDNIIMVPQEIDSEWIFYNKKSDELSYRNIVKYKFISSGLYVIEKKGYLLPATTKDPIIIIDLDTMKICHTIYNWNKDIILDKKKSYYVWALAGIVVNKDVFFYLHDTKYVIKANLNCVNVFLIDIPYGICSMDYVDNIFWILPAKGEFIYMMGGNGEVLGAINLNLDLDKYIIDVSNFIRIVATNKYIFLLPVMNKEICIYNVEDQCIDIINVKEKVRQNILPILGYRVPYWWNYMEKNYIYFMPLESKALIIDLERYEWNQKDICLPVSISEYDLIYWYGQNQWNVKNNISKELDIYSIKLYCEFIKKRENLENIDNKKEKGKLILEKIKS